VTCREACISGHFCIIDRSAIAPEVREPIRRRFRAFDASYGVSFDLRLPMAFLAASFFALRTISKGTKGTL
jgi:hypothetical protein